MEGQELGEYHGDWWGMSANGTVEITLYHIHQTEDCQECMGEMAQSVGCQKERAVHCLASRSQSTRCVMERFDLSLAD